MKEWERGQLRFVCVFFCELVTGSSLTLEVGLNTDCEALVSKGYMSARAKAHRDRVFYTIYVQDMYVWQII